MDVVHEAPSLAAALGALNTRREEEEARIATELAELEAEVAGVRNAIANLQHQLEALVASRDELVAKRDALTEAPGAVYEAVLGTLTAQAAKVSARGDEIRTAEAARAARLGELLQDAEAKRLLEEYNQFKTVVEPTLAGLPASYRDVIAAHHKTVTERLQAMVAAADPGPVTASGPPVEVDVVYAIDAPEGSAELVMLVLPVPDAVQSGWRDRAEDVPLRLAARVVQALYEACKAAGQPGAHAMYGGHRGLLAVEVELAGGDPEKFAKILGDALQARLSGAPELAAAGVVARGQRTEVDHLLPPEEASDAE